MIQSLQEFRLRFYRWTTEDQFANLRWIDTNAHAYLIIAGYDGATSDIKDHLYAHWYQITL